MSIRPDLKWSGADEFSSLNTRNAEDRVLPTELVDISNFSYDKLGAIKKISGNAVSSVISPGDFVETTVTATITTDGTTQIVIPAGAISIYFKKLVLVGSGGGGGGGGGGAWDGSYSAGGGGGGGGHGYHIVETNYNLVAGNTYEIVVGAGGAGGAGNVGGKNSAGVGITGVEGEVTILKIADSDTLLTANAGLGGIGGGPGSSNIWIGDYVGYGGPGGVGVTNGTAGSAGTSDGGAGGAGSSGDPSGEETGDETGGDGGNGGAGGGDDAGSHGGSSGVTGKDGWAYYELSYLTEV